MDFDNNEVIREKIAEILENINSDGSIIPVDEDLHKLYIDTANMLTALTLQNEVLHSYMHCDTKAVRDMIEEYYRFQQDAYKLYTRINDYRQEKRDKEAVARAAKEEVDSAF